MPIWPCFAVLVFLFEAVEARPGTIVIVVALALPVFSTIAVVIPYLLLKMCCFNKEKAEAKRKKGNDDTITPMFTEITTPIPSNSKSKSEKSASLKNQTAQVNTPKSVPKRKITIPRDSSSKSAKNKTTTTTPTTSPGQELQNKNTGQQFKMMPGNQRKYAQKLKATNSKEAEKSKSQSLTSRVRARLAKLMDKQPSNDPENDAGNDQVKLEQVSDSGVVLMPNPNPDTGPNGDNNDTLNFVIDDYDDTINVEMPGDLSDPPFVNAVEGNPEATTSPATGDAPSSPAALTPEQQNEPPQLPKQQQKAENAENNNKQGQPPQNADQQKQKEQESDSKNDGVSFNVFETATTGQQSEEQTVGVKVDPSSDEEKNGKLLADPETATTNKSGETVVAKRSKLKLKSAKGSKKKKNKKKKKKRRVKVTPAPDGETDGSKKDEQIQSFY